MMRVELVASTPSPAGICGEAAAVCTDSRNPESAMRHAVGSGHTSVLEHAVFTFRVEGLSRAALAQLTRHRLASFDVQSQRYVRINGIDLVTFQGILGISRGEHHQRRHCQSAHQVKPAEVGHVDIEKEGIDRLLFHLLACFHSTLAQSHTLQPRHLANVFLQLLQRQRLVVNGQTTYFQFVTHYY